MKKEWREMRCVKDQYTKDSCRIKKILKEGEGRKSPQNTKPATKTRIKCSKIDANIFPRAPPSWASSREPSQDGGRRDGGRPRGSRERRLCPQRAPPPAAPDGVQVNRLDICNVTWILIYRLLWILCDGRLFSG